MICQQCGKETVKGKYCQYCGATLNVEEESAATIEQDVEQQEIVVNEPVATSTQQTTTEPEQSQFVEGLKEESANLGKFLLSNIKNPAKAKDIKDQYFISGIITIILFAITLTLNSYLIYNPSYREFGEDFFIPLLKYILMFGLLATIIFGASRAVLQEMTIKGMLAKYGAYLIPFFAIYLIGFFLQIIQLTVLSVVISFFSLLGIIFLIPVFILSEQKVKGLDAIYTNIVVCLLSFIPYYYLATGFLSLF